MEWRNDDYLITDGVPKVQLDTVHRLLAMSALPDMIRARVIQVAKLRILSGGLSYEQRQFDAIGAPILSAACYCDDCQEGARQIEALPSASPVLDGDGGTEYLLYRKDRMKLSKGGDLLRHYKIKDDSPTIRACRDML